MISIPHAVIHKITMMIKTFDTFAAYLAMNTPVRPQDPAKEAKIFQISIFFNSVIKKLIKRSIRDAFGKPWISTSNDC